MNSDRNLLQEVVFRLRYPKMSLLAANILYHKARKNLGLVDGVDVMEEDWDNLIILDACRYDAFAEVIPDYPEIPGELEARRSKAPYTREFIQEAFHQRDLHDTVYVTASPQLHDNSDEVDAEFHAVANTFLNEYVPDSIDATESGYRPGPTTEIARRVNREFQNKRLIVHYLTPHWPFLGERGRSLFGDYDDAPWEELTAGTVSIPSEDLWTAYVENLRFVLDYVVDLLPELEGKTVITADHGQLLGDELEPIPIAGYGHPGVFVEPLLKVPWFVCEHDTRKRIVSESPVETSYDEVDPEKAEQKAKETLRELGYVPE